MKAARPPASHRSTTAHLQAVYPFVAEDGFGGRGTLVGRDLFGGSFCFDPWERYRQGDLTNPNLLVIGQVGRGKSTFVKTFLWRQQVFGHHAWVVDPKGEYGALADACGTVPVRVAPGGHVRLNPLDPGPADTGREGDPGHHDDNAVLPGGPARRRAELLGTVVASSLGRGLGPSERTAIDLAVGTAISHYQHAVLADVVHALLDPTPEAASSVRTDVAGLAHDGRQVALELRRLVEGDLAGMFDGQTTASIDLNAPLVILDLSALYASPALPILMTCATAWLQAALGARDGVKRIVVVDEAWAVLRDLATARWLQAGFKLSRALGVAHIAVLHRLSDLRASGAVGSEQQRLAEGLLADSETRVIFGQPPSEVQEAGNLLGLSSTEAELLPHLPRGVALWKVADRSFLIEHQVAAGEVGLVDTDAAMVDS